MATVIDVGFLNNFAEVFMFLLIFAVLYGALTKIDFFKLGDKGKGLHAIIAVTVALLTLISGNVTAMIGTMVPWFFVLFLFIILMIISAMLFGVSNDQMAKVIGKPEAFSWIIIFGAIILLFSLGAGFGQQLLEEQPGVNDNGDDDSNGGIGTTGGDSFGGEVTTNTGTYESDLVRTIFHPKVLGLMLLGIIGLITSIFITKTD